MSTRPEPNAKGFVPPVLNDVVSEPALPVAHGRPRWLSKYICLWKSGYWYATEDEDLEGPYDTPEQAEAMFKDHCRRLRNEMIKP